jgi:prepilin-type processing-associated H-X9-DG protein/prepilin-type N-terminal cleavage/methylation domain-containing protein
MSPQQEEMRMTRLQKIPRGLSLVEVLVVMAIVGLLLALLLPAIQAARESARRTECVNRLRQIGFALHSFERPNRCLPSGYVSKFTPGVGDTGPGWGWAALLLNYIEETSLSAALHFDEPIEGSMNSAYRTKLVSIYQCPSDTAAGKWAAYSAWLPFGDDPIPESKVCDVASANYIAMSDNGQHPRSAGAGLFFQNSHVPFRQITDGASKTIAIGERSSRQGTAAWVGAVTGARLHLVQYDNTGRRWLASFHASAMVLGQALDLDGNGGPIGEQGMFSSQHPGGVNFAFADGHVAFLSTETEYRAFEALSTRAGGEATF